MLQRYWRFTLNTSLYIPNRNTACLAGLWYFPNVLTFTLCDPTPLNFIHSCLSLSSLKAVPEVQAYLQVVYMGCDPSGLEREPEEWNGKSGKGKDAWLCWLLLWATGGQSHGSSKEFDEMLLRFFCPGNETGGHLSIDFCLPLVKGSPWC